jgi:hypothetical protein
MQHAKTISVIGTLMLVIVFFSKCFNDKSAGNDPRGELYAGAANCTGCHKEITASAAHTGHFKTSAPVNHGILKKIADTAKKYFYYLDSSHVRLQENNGEFSQALFINDKKETVRKFDIAFGSAEKAQTYGGWDRGQLYQLPLTYFSSMNVWANSPGFPTNHPKFDRLIISGCFQCHSTYIAKEIVPSGSLAVVENFYPNTLIPGIDCERCHGPAAAHVKYQRENPGVKTAKYITAIKSLSRQQKLDVCGTCHSGNDRSEMRSIFSFVPGDTLANFYFPEFGFGSSNKVPDVHGKQMQLLQSGKCFQKSEMTCGTCHNPHEQQRNNTTLFVSKCMNCHGQSAHAKNFMQKITETKNTADLEKMSCITCHMPLQDSKKISFKDGTTEKSLAYYLRTHRIGVY